MRFFKKHRFLTIILLVFSFFLYENFTKAVDYDRNTEKESNHFVNELYKSDDSIYNNYLSEEDQKMYDLILSMAKNYQIRKVIPLEEYNCEDYVDCSDFIDTANSALYVDHPELMNYAGYRWRYHNHILTLSLQYSYHLPIKDTIGLLRTEKIIANIEEKTKNMTDQEKILYVYNWMGENNTYDNIFTYLSKNQSIYNVFVKKNAVCAGFAKASQIIFQKIGIESYVIQGSSNVEHMWNIVKYEDKYYYFDSTIAVSVKNKNSLHYYDGLKQSEMNYYTVKFPDWYPKVEKTNMFEIQ